MKHLLLIARLVFGAWMLLSGLNHFFLHFYAEPAGHEPLAVQLMSALFHSGLINVAMGIQLVAGALILIGFFVPLALCVTMPICVCAAYWAVILEHEPIGALLALVAVALNAVLLFAHLGSYRDMLKRHALTAGESDGADYRSLFVDPRGRIARGPFIAALIPLALVALFYHFIVFGRSGQWAMIVLLFPAIVIHARRLHDMGKTAWLLLIAAIPIAAGIWLHMFAPPSDLKRPVIFAALALSALFTLWGLLGKGRGDTERRAAPATGRRAAG
ncbi:MAG: DUF805 domain-containing protein [Sphingobium sp.]|nr:DUF805 domain-containing protein [Sphingobium sp.]